MFLNIRAEYVDNKIMKNLWKILTFLFLLTLASCMPDSLTKFKEEPTKKADTTTSSGGSGTTTAPGSTCVIGVDPLCTSPGSITYPAAEHEHLIAENGTAPSAILIEAFFPSQILDQDEYILVTADPDFATKTGFIVHQETGDLENNSLVFLPKTSFLMTAIYSTPELASDEVSSDTVTFTQATDLKSISIPVISGQKLIVTLDDVSLFTTTAGYNNFVTPSGATGTITFIDTPNKELHVDIQPMTSATGTIRVDDEVDNNTTFFTSRAKVTKVYYAFNRDYATQTALVPLVEGHATLSDTEKRSITYSIFPALPTGLSFDKADGTIGTLRGYQVLEDGTINTVAGSRTVTGVSTQFLTHLQVGSSVTINSERHKVESIVSNTEFTTYIPLTSTANGLPDIRKNIKGSLQVTGGSSFITGHGTDFNPDIVTTKLLKIDAVGTFTGFSSLVTINSDSSLTISSGNFAGTALTIPELKATEYLISAKNILNKTISIRIELGLLGTIQPKTIGELKYLPSVGDKLVLQVAASSSFTKGGTVSTENGTIATIEDITSNALYVTLVNIGNKCTDISFSNSTDCVADGEEWTSTAFNNGDGLDNNSFFFAGETTLTNDVIRAFPFSSSPSISPAVTPSSISLASLTYSIAPDISSGQGFCSNTTYANEFDCLSDPLNLSVPVLVWTQGLTFSTTTGVISGSISTQIPTTSFTVTATNLLGRTAQKVIRIAVNEKPTGLSVSRSTLLHVPSSSAFSIGDAITGRNGATGTVSGKFSINGNSTAKGFWQFEFLEVNIISGRFEEFEDIDNLPNFMSQKTYILGQGVYEYNAKLSVGNSSIFKDPEYSDYLTHENLLEVSAVERARIVFNDISNNTLFVNSYDTEDKAISIEPVLLTTGQQIDAVNLAGVPNQNITNIESQSLILSVPLLSGIPSSAKGYVISSNTDEGVAELNKVSGTDLYISMIEGFLSPTQTIDDVSPYVGSHGAISTITNESALYFYRGQDSSASVNLYSQDSATTIEIAPPLPLGLSLSTAADGSTSITGTPTGKSVKTKYTLTATNSFGSTTSQFFIKVVDHFALVDKTGASSYILHKSGKGNGRKPCMITEDQMTNGNIDTQDITCYLDVGESDLESNGVKLEMSSGLGICQFVSHEPYRYWKLPPSSDTQAAFTTLPGTVSVTLGTPNVTGVGTAFESYFRVGGQIIIAAETHTVATIISDTSLTLLSNHGAGAAGVIATRSSSIYIHSGYDQCTSNAPANAESYDLAGTYPMSSMNHPDLHLFPDSVDKLCMYNYDTQIDDEYFDGAECDTSSITQTEISWEENTIFQCEDSGNTPTGDVTFTDCYHNNGTCSAGGHLDQTLCEDASETWTFNGFHNQPSAGPGGTLLPPIGDCSVVSVNAAADYDCGGDINTCKGGALTNSTIDWEAGYNTSYSNLSIPGATGIVAADYGKHDILYSSGNNNFYANHLKQCFTDAYTPNTASVIATVDASASQTSYMSQGANPFYTFECTNGSGDLKARIRLIVRDFDRDFKVKEEFCDNPAFTTEATCTGADTWIKTGIEFYNPDSALGIATDPRNFLENDQLDGFGIFYDDKLGLRNYTLPGYVCGDDFNATDIDFQNGQWPLFPAN